MSDPKWEPARFAIATPNGAQIVGGHIYRGLGMYQTLPASPKGRRPPTWCLMHLASGHAIVDIKKHNDSAFDTAAQIAEMADWSFIAPDGWRNSDPDLINRIKALLVFDPGLSRFGGTDINYEIARTIAESRA